MLAFLSAKSPAGVIYHGLQLMRGPQGKRWIAMPEVKPRGKDGQLVLGEDGKPMYDAVIEFRDRATRERFGAMILQALRADWPELFEGGS